MLSTRLISLLITIATCVPCVAQSNDQPVVPLETGVDRIFLQGSAQQEGAKQNRVLEGGADKQASPFSTTQRKNIPNSGMPDLRPGAAVTDSSAAAELQEQLSKHRFTLDAASIEDVRRRGFGSRVENHSDLPNMPTPNYARYSIPDSRKHSYSYLPEIPIPDGVKYSMPTQPRTQLPSPPYAPTQYNAMPPIDLPTLPASRNLNPVDATELERALSKAKPLRLEQIPGTGPRGISGDGDLSQELRRARTTVESIPVAPPKAPLQSIEYARPQIQPLPDLEIEVRRQQALTKPIIDRQLAQAKSELETIMHRPIFTTAIPGSDTGENALLWDAWYRKFANLYEPALIESIEQSGGSAGANTVYVTIDRNHHLQVRLQNGGGSKFDQATLAAYKSLDGNGALAFPLGSLRTEVSMYIDNNHQAPGDVSNIRSRTLTGDREGRKY